MKVGFIGLGGMGSGMARNLLKAGHDLIVYDLRKESMQPFLEAGAKRAETVADVGRGSEVVFTSLPGPKEMKAVGLGEGGLLETMAKGTTWFDLTTNSVTLVREVYGRCKEMGIALLDAPVSGGPSGASSGKLAVYVGGDRDVFDCHKTLLDGIGDAVLYVGDIGAGNSAKLVHNLASFSIRMLISEVFTLGVKAGVDPAELWHAIRVGAVGRERTFDSIGNVYLQEKYDPPSFTVRLAHKDLTLGLDLARELDVPMKQVEVAYAAFDELMQQGLGDKDARYPMRIQNERAGVSIRLSAEEVKKARERGG